jgi:hypothetical protein
MYVKIVFILWNYVYTFLYLKILASKSFGETVVKLGASDILASI